MPQMQGLVRRGARATRSRAPRAAHRLRTSGTGAAAARGSGRASHDRAVPGARRPASRRTRHRRRRMRVGQAAVDVREGSFSGLPRPGLGNSLRRRTSAAGTKDSRCSRPQTTPAAVGAAAVSGRYERGGFGRLAQPGSDSDHAGETWVAAGGCDAGAAVCWVLFQKRKLMSSLSLQVLFSLEGEHGNIGQGRALHECATAPTSAGRGATLWQPRQAHRVTPHMTADD
jgi:hypothetical protein